eukprot:6368169-Prymnesium_polylepis.1
MGGVTCHVLLLLLGGALAAHRSSSDAHEHLALRAARLGGAAAVPALASAADAADRGSRRARAASQPRAPGAASLQGVQRAAQAGPRDRVLRARVPPVAGRLPQQVPAHARQVPRRAGPHRAQAVCSCRWPRWRPGSRCAAD